MQRAAVEQGAEKGEMREEKREWKMWGASNTTAHGAVADAPTHHSHDTSRDHSYHGAVPCENMMPTQPGACC